MKECRIKLLLVIQRLDSGGAEAQVVRLAPCINQELFDVQVAYYYKTTSSLSLEPFERANIKTVYLDRSKWGRLAFMFKAADFMRRERFDIVHSWHGSANIYGTVTAKMAGIPVIIGGIRGKHGSNIHWQLKSIINSICCCWITNAQSIKDMALEKMKSIKDSRIFVVPNGIELNNKESYQLRRSIVFDKWKSDRPVIGTVGRLDSIKNHLLFIDMARLLIQSGCAADFWIIGEGPMRAQIESAVQENGLGDVFKMWGIRRDVNAALSRMDVFVLSSDSEGCPNVLLEAMGASLPVVSTNCTNLEHIIQEEVNGHIVKVGDANALAQKVRLILSDDAKRRKMGINSLRMVKERFSLPMSSRQLQDTYINCLKMVMTRNPFLRKKLQYLALI